VEHVSRVLIVLDDEDDAATQAAGFLSGFPVTGRHWRVSRLTI
jgi:hypothetical protein